MYPTLSTPFGHNKSPQSGSLETSYLMGRCSDHKSLLSDKKNHPSTELNENLSKNTFGDQVTLINNQDYTCPTDGYFRIVCGYQEKSKAVGFINDINLVVLSSTNSSSVVINNSMASIIFVRAGMTIKYTGTNAQGYFIPLI